MTRSKFKLILLISILMLSNVFVQNIASADTHVLPQIGDGEDSPLLDGNITSTEWNTSVTFTANLNGRDTTIFVTTDSTTLFIGFNMTSSNFVSVNDTFSDDPEYSLSYSNETHDWFAIVFDNNLDKEISASSIGTSGSPDDAIVLDQYETGSYDAYADGNSTVPFFPDETIEYTSGTEDTILTGNGGINNTQSVRNITSSQVIYEVSKPLQSGDDNGYDFDINDLGILQFKLFSFTNSQANDTFVSAASNVDETDWISLRVSDEGDKLTTKSISETSVSLIGHNLPDTDVDAFQTLSELYGFNLNFQDTDSNVTYADHDLNIFVVGDDASLSNAQLDRLRSYVRSGGNVMVLLGNSDSSARVAELFELSFLSNPVLQDTNETQLSVDQFNGALPFLSQDVLTSKNVSQVNFSSSALNMTDLSDETNKYVLGQEFIAYDLFEYGENIAYDKTNNGTIDESDTFENLSLGVGLDLLKGGRVSILPTTSLLTDGSIVEGDNINYLLRLLPWNARIVNTIDIQSTDVDKRTIVEGQSIEVSVNMTDGLGNELDIQETVLVEVTIAGGSITTLELTKMDNSTMYTGEVTINQNGFLIMEITGMADGYGFSEGQSQDIYVESDVQSFNDLSKLSSLVGIVFLVSILAFALVYLRIRKY